jgi:hypothetical protein
MAKNNNKYSAPKYSTTSYSAPKPVAKSSTSEPKVTPVAPKVTPVTAPKKASIVIPTGEALMAEIRKTAQEVWERKGRPNGKDMENWVEAETIVKKKYGIK